MRIHTTITAGLVAFAMGASSCAYDEGLLIENLRGKVRIPAADVIAITQNEDGSTTETPDPRLIGPVYLGLYSAIEPANVVARYPHPSVGPQFQDGQVGDSYPYGGTTIGDIRFACVESLSCKMTSGRFVDWQQIVDWFIAIDDPVIDAFRRPITDGEVLRQICYDILDYTSDDETRITVWEDRNGNDDFDSGDLDFVLDETGEFFVADFEMLQQEFFWDVDQADCTPGVDCRGFSLWGWMDAPSDSASDPNRFNTCRRDFGFNANVYENDFISGSVWFDVLNFPQRYISDGDIVSSVPFQWDNIEDEPVLTLDFKVQ